MNSPTADLIARLDQGGFDPKPTSPDSWESRCPAHNGSRRNLSITQGDDGRALVHCHHAPACDPAAIVAPLGMSLADLFPDDGTRESTPKPKPQNPKRAHPTPEAALAGLIRKHGKPSASWQYQHADGPESFRVYRFDFANPTPGKPDRKDKEYRPVHRTEAGWVVGDPKGPLPLYHLPEFADAEQIYVCEGEKSADLIRGLGLTATTSAHGAQSPHKSDWKPLTGKHVVILPDHDEPGEDYVKDVPALLAKLNPRPTVKVVRLADIWKTTAEIPKGGDAAEWLLEGVPDSWDEDDCRAELDRVVSEAPAVDLDLTPTPETTDDGEPRPGDIVWTGEPRPIRDDRQSPVPKLTDDMIPEPLRDWLADIAARVGCPLEFPVAAAVVALGILVGRKIGIRPKRYDDWTVVPNLWGAIVGRPGVMKTPALKEAIRQVRRLEADARAAHGEALTRFDADSLIADARKEAAKNDLKAAAKAKKSDVELEHLAKAVRDTETPAAPTLRRYTTADPTVEALGEQLANNPNIGIIRDELTGWMRTLDKPEQGPARAFYLEAWDGTGATFQYDRIGRGHIVIENPTVSILGGIQPGPLRSLVRDTAKGESGDDGLISRFQILVWPDIDREWRNVDQWPDALAKNRAYAVFTSLDKLSPSDVGATADDPDDVPYLRFDPEAQEFFNGWREKLENDTLRADDESPLIESHLAKYRKLMPALALIFHLAEFVDGKASGPVSLRAAELAVSWCEFLEAHARRVYSCLNEPDIEAARELAKKIKANALPSPFTARDVYRRCWSRLDDKQAVRQAVAFLEERGWLQTVETMTGGKTREDTHIHPSLLGTGDEI